MQNVKMHPSFTTWTVIAVGLAGLSPFPSSCGPTPCRAAALGSNTRRFSGTLSEFTSDEDARRLVGRERSMGVAAAEDASPPSPPAGDNPAPADAETTTEYYEAGDEGGGTDLGSEILNILLEIVGTLISLVTDPPGAIEKILDQAKELFGGARSLINTGPHGARQARAMLHEANRLLHSARRLMSTTNRITNAAHHVMGALGRLG